MNYPKIATQHFNNGFNCAQATAKAIAKALEMDENAAEALTAGFGGGIGGHQEICGAVSGACLMLSQYYYNQVEDQAKSKEAATKATKRLINDFKEAYKEATCLGLVRTDFSIEGAKNLFLEEGGKENICIPAVEFAVKRALEMTGKLQKFKD
ncbi:MAG: C-GCAxxG-C-C family protein [Clostridiales bacterium]|nr:C-GCAxxG-C-C family protein [Clostridiales bacterium]